MSRHFIRVCDQPFADVVRSRLFSAGVQLLMPVAELIDGAMDVRGLDTMRPTGEVRDDVVMVGRRWRLVPVFGFEVELLTIGDRLRHRHHHLIVEIEVPVVKRRPRRRRLIDWRHLPSRLLGRAEPGEAG